MNNFLGTNLKGYELLERIGAGGFGAVYRARQTTIEREVAVKVILPGLANEPDFIRRFEMEARLITRLEHPHITPLHDFWRDADGAYLVMRYLRGGSLRDALYKEGAYDLASTSRLLDQIASALDFAHRNNVIHRDIKPGNILLDEDGNAYLADFGIAKDLINVKNGHTNPDSVVGSLDYISPEQARSEAVTPRTDIYSLGVTLYELITGEHPFKECSSVERLYKHLNEPLPAIAHLAEDMRDTINEIIHRATAKNPDQRYPDVLALALAFREAVGRGDSSHDLNIIEQLTWREQEVLQLIAEGRSNKEIADHLVVTLATVRWHIRQVYKKLGVRGRVHAIVRARELDLIVSGDTDYQPAKGSVPAIALPEPENPYKGLRPFEAVDSRDFFGREEFTEKLIWRMAENEGSKRFLAVVGPSGSGKSSLVKAGLIPALWKGGLPHSEKWFVVEMIPGSRPLDQLEVALLRVAAHQTAGLHEQLRRDENGLLRVADIILPKDQTELVLVLDQFEELFTLVQEEYERIQFLNLLRAAVTDPRSRIRVIMTLRADYYDRPLHYPEFGELLRSRMETVLPLSAKGLERAIAGPAERVGVSFEPGLVAQIVSEMNYQAGALPLLQYALTELFERRQGRMMTHQSYREIGGAIGALTHRADEIYGSLDASAQELARQMFLRLVTLGEGAEDTRRRTPRSELLQLTSSADLIDDIIDMFADYRLLSLDKDPGSRQPTVEVAHEAILREWERLHLWLDESREDIRLQRHLMTLTAEWESAKRDAGFLLRGSRLEIFEKWASETQLALTAKEREYLDTSVAQREKEQEQEESRHARELKLAHEAAQFAQHAAQMQQRAANRLRTLVAVLVLAIIGALVLSGVVVNKSIEAQNARSTSEANAQLSQSLALASGAQVALSEGKLDLALTLAVAANQIEEPPALAQRILFEAAYGPGVVRIFSGHTDAVRSVSVSPDGRTMLSASQDGSLILWDVQTGEQLRQFTGHEGNVWTVVFHPDGQTALSGSVDRTLILWDIETGELLRRFTGHTADVRMVAISPNGRTALSASYDHLAILWDIETGAEIRRFVGHEDWLWTVAFSPDGRTMLSGSGNQEGGSPDTTMRLWNLETGEEMRRFEGHTDTVRTVMFSPDGRTALSGSFDSTLILWDLNTGAEIRRFEGHTHRVISAAFSSDARTILSGSGDTTLILWDVATGQPIHQFKGHSDAVVSVALGTDGHSAFSASHDRTLRLWDLESTAEVYQIANTLPVPASVYTAFSPDGQTMALRLGPTNVSLRDAETGQLIRYLEGYEGKHLYSADWNEDDSLRSIVFSPDGRILATGREGGGWILWDAVTGQAIRRFGEGETKFGVLAFSPDGRWLATPGDAVVRLWDIETGTESRHFEGSSDWVNELAFSPDGRYLAAAFGTYTGASEGGTSDTSLRVWEINTGEEIHRLEHPAQVTGVAFSPDGQTLYSSAYDGALREWDFASGRELRRLVGSESGLVKMALSADGSYLISGAYSGEIVVWNLETGEQLRRFRVDGEPDSVAFSPDGTYALGGGGQHGSLHLWRLALNLDELLDWTYANREVRELNCTERELYRIEPPCNWSRVSFLE
jgi:WD40 repeat protein/DNA-binding CsgD family transcriptional regulator